MGRKMAKIALKELKFGPDMYFYEFYQIPEDFWKIFKIGRFLAEKPPFSAFFASRFRNFFFDGNRIRAFKNAQIRLKIGHFENFPKNLLEFDKTHRNTCLVCISAHLEHF